MCDGVYVHVCTYICCVWCVHTCVGVSSVQMHVLGVCMSVVYVSVCTCVHFVCMGCGVLVCVCGALCIWCVCECVHMCMV